MTDAYVIRGKGNSANNIVITATKKTTVYLMDLEWSGSIIFNKSNNIDFIVCGSVVNKKEFLVPVNAAQNQINNLTFSSIKDTAVFDVNTNFLRQIAINKLTIKDLKMKAANTLIDSSSIGEMLIENCEITVKQGLFNASTVKKSSYIRSQIQADKMDQYGSFRQEIHYNNNIADTTMQIEAS